MILILRYISYYDTYCIRAGNHLLGQSGNIGSPGWPEKYDGKDFAPDGVCKWLIKSRDPNQMIQVNFFGISLTSIDYLTRKDTLKIKGEHLFIKLFTNERLSEASFKRLIRDSIWVTKLYGNK